MSKQISILIIAESYASDLERTLPGLLAQHYDPGYEVIVVRESQKGETIDVLTPLMTEHTNLRTTYIPDVPQYITDSEVAIMLGTKAAKYDNIVIIHPTYETPSDNWINEVASLLDGQKVVIGRPHYHKKQNFLNRFFHRRRAFKILKPWCERASLSLSDMKLKKSSRDLINVAYSKQEYLCDDDLRYFIYRFTNP